MAMPLPSYDLADTPPVTDRSPAHPRVSRGGRFAWIPTVLIGLLHGWAVWTGLGGREGITGEWPPLYADHGIHYHHGLVTRHFLKTTGVMAGYDPSFMSGYAMS